MVRVRSFFVTLLRLLPGLGGAVLICTLLGAGVGYGLGAPVGGAFVGAALGVLAGIRMYFSPAYRYVGDGRQPIVRDMRETGPIGGAGSASVGMDSSGGFGGGGDGGSC